jgi:hypothetical protein
MDCSLAKALLAKTTVMPRIINKFFILPSVLVPRRRSSRGVGLPGRAEEARKSLYSLNRKFLAVWFPPGTDFEARRSKFHDYLGKSKRLVKVAYGLHLTPACSPPVSSWF